MSFFRNLAGVLVTGAVGVPVGVLTSVLLARLLSTDDRGLYALALSFAAITTMLFQFGWPTASIFRLRGAGTRPAQVSGATLLFLGGTFAAVVFGAALLGPLLRERFLSGLPAAAFGLALASVPLRALGNGFGAIARGIDRFRYENAYAFALQVGSLAAAVLALVWWRGGLVELLWALVVVHLVAAGGLLATVIRQTGIDLRVSAHEMDRSFRFGLKTYAMTLTGRLHERIDVLMLAYLLVDPTPIAFYAVAKGGIQMIQVLPDSLGKVAYPQLAGLPPEDAARFACTLVRQGLLLMLPASGVLFAAAPLLLPLVYGAPYAASTLPFLLMVPGVVLLGVDRVLSRYFTGTNQHEPNVITRAVSLAVNVVLNWLWIPVWGIGGAAAAALVSYVVDAVLLVAVFLWITDCTLGDLLIVRREDLDPYRRQLARIARRLRPAP